MALLPQASRPRLIVIIVTAAAVAVLAGVGVYGLIIGPPEHHESQQLKTTHEPTASATTADDDAPTSWHDLPALPDTNDPVTYAKAVAEAIFTWDTMSGLAPDDYSNVIVVEADPSGVETAGLLTDLANYLPDETWWHKLREYETSQELTITAAYVPDSWQQIADASAAQLVDGTTAVTLEGTRHREGVWLGDASSSEHPVAFTVFVACKPTYSRCHTLRLSELDNPLR